MKVAVIGAGVAGITTAYALSKHNCQVDVYEAGPRVGGMAATFELWDQRVDIGPHRFFSNDKRVNDLWLEVVGDDYEMVNRLTRIYYRRRFFKYPLEIGNLLGTLGFIEAGHCLLSYLVQKISVEKKDGTFEAWVKNRFGKKLFYVFFKSYTQKLWGMPCNEIDADFAAQRIRKLSLYEAIKNAAWKGQRNRHKTLVDQFAYPFGGTGMVYERMANAVREAGNNIFTNTPVYGVVNDRKKVTGILLEDGSYREYDHVVSTMPYTAMVKRLTEAPPHIVELAGKLKFRNTIIVYLLINSTDLFPDNWIYIHSPELQMGRVTNFRNWVPHLYKNEQKTILAIEYWCNEDAALWNTADEDLINLAATEMVKTNLVNANLIEDGFVYRIAKCYPVYTKGYKEIVTPINAYLASLKNLSVIGRYGSFKYNNQDHSIIMGLKAAENIIDNAGHDLFGINADYEVYQESYIVKETGLQKH